MVLKRLIIKVRSSHHEYLRTSMREDWEKGLLGSGLAEWHYEGCGKILRLVSTNYYLISRDIWLLDLRDLDLSGVEIAPRDLTPIHPMREGFIEELFDELSEDMQIKMAFNWDLFVGKNLD